MYASPNIFKKVSTPMTFILLAINTLGYIIEVILSRGAFVLIDTDVLIFLGQYNLLVLKYGWWWQLITSMFIHRSIMHFLFNMFWLWLLGVQYERMFGGESLIFTYVLSGLAGNILTLLLSPLNVVSLGASGAIFGIFGVLLLFQAIVSGKILQSLAYGFIIFIIIFFCRFKIFTAQFFKYHIFSRTKQCNNLFISECSIQIFFSNMIE